MSWFEQVPINIPLFIVLELKRTLFCPRWPPLRLSFFCLVLRIGFFLLHEQSWLVFYPILWNRQSMISVLEISQLSLWMTLFQIWLLRDFAAPAMESIILTTISWQLGQYFSQRLVSWKFLVIIHVSYKLREIWNAENLYQIIMD